MAVGQLVRVRGLEGERVGESSCEVRLWEGKGRSLPLLCCNKADLHEKKNCNRIKPEHPCYLSYLNKLFCVSTFVDSGSASVPQEV